MRTTPPSVTIPIYGNADGLSDGGGKYCPKYLEINLYFGTGHEAVLNLGNGNGTYSDGDYTGSSASGGDALRYGTGALDNYADADGNVTIHLPSDDDLGAEFTVVNAAGTEGDDDYLPDVTIGLGRAQAYDYQLVGWINIATGEYYDVSEGSATAEINLSDDNVFYADWIGADYNSGSAADANLRDDTVSTSSFVTFRLFDYNELFNLYSVSLEQNSTNGESWTDSEYLYSEPLLSKEETAGSPIGNSFIFQNNGTTHASSHVLSHANPARWNLWTSNSVWANYKEYNFVLDAEEYWNITSPDSTILGMLYDTDEESLGVHYVGEGDYLFWIDEDGYYTYNSAVSGAAYNQNDERFYVYEDPANAFFPYNGHTESMSGTNGSVDYWFGMYMEVEFYLPNSTAGGSEANPVNQINGRDMTFDFSGDDDIMIFVDDKLIVDMSGIHSTSYSRINFSTNTVTYSVGLDETGAPDTTGAKGKYSIDENLDLNAGYHTMQIFYMERGASASNLKIQFNLTPTWEYESWPVQTVTAEKTWMDAQGNVIEDTTVLPEEYQSVEVGLFDVLGAEEKDDDGNATSFGYTKDGSTYTVKYTDDSGISHTYVYTAGTNAFLTHIIQTDENRMTSTMYNNTDSEGRVVDSDGCVIAWLEGETLYIRIDQQTLSEANGWSYAWELLDADGSYEVLELSESSSYTTTSEREDITVYEYWSIIGETEIEEHLADGSDLSSFPILLTEAAQETTETLGDTQEALGWVIVATGNGLETKQVEFSHLASLEEMKSEDGITTGYLSRLGVTSKSEIDALGSGAVWYMIDANDRIENMGDAEEFYLYCYLGDTPYYLTLNETENNLTVTTDPENAAKFYYDFLGELRVVRADGSGSDRVVISATGEISLDVAENEADTDDVRIYTLTETETKGFAFTATNAFLPDLTVQKVNSETEEPLAGAEFTLTFTDEDGNTYYYGGLDENNEVIWTLLEEGTTAKAFETQDFSETGRKGDGASYAVVYEGAVIFHYLPDGTYTLTETKAPNGYDLLPSAITIVIENGTIQSKTEGETVIWSVSWASDTTEDIYDYVSVLDENGLTITVENVPGVRLPNTGGIGTAPFTVAGLLLIAAAVCLFGVKRKYAASR